MTGILLAAFLTFITHNTEIDCGELDKALKDEQVVSLSMQKVLTDCVKKNAPRGVAEERCGMIARHYEIHKMLIEKEFYPIFQKYCREN